MVHAVQVHRNEAFHQAASRGHVDAIDVLLAHGADVDAFNLVSAEMLWAARCCAIPAKF